MVTSCEPWLYFTYDLDFFTRSIDDDLSLIKYSGVIRNDFFFAITQF